MLQAIELKFYGPTKSRGPRIKATAQCGTRWTEWDGNQSSDGNFTRAARLFAEHWGWDGRWIGGATENGYVFVRSSGRDGAGAFTVESDY